MLSTPYFARPLGDGPFPAMVLIHHLPGWDELYRDFTRKFAHHGYLAISPDLYHRFGHGTPDDVAAQARAEGGAPDDQVIADMSAAADYIRSLPYSNGKVGVFGTCSGGRHAFLCACRSTSFDAAVECWGGRVVQGADDLTPQQPVAPIDYTADLSCSLLGLFGAEDASPTPEEVAQHEQALKDAGKDYEFPHVRWRGAWVLLLRTAARTGKSRLWMAGTSSSTSSVSIWRDSRRQ